MKQQSGATFKPRRHFSILTILIVWSAVAGRGVTLQLPNLLQVFLFVVTQPILNCLCCKLYRDQTFSLSSSGLLPGAILNVLQRNIVAALVGRRFREKTGIKPTVSSQTETKGVFTSAVQFT